MKSAFVSLALASASSAQQPPIAVTNSPPPPIVAVPVVPPPVIVPRPVVPANPPPPLALVLPEAGVTIIRGPQPRRPAQSYVSRDDYPASALARREEGRVRMLLGVGPNGRVVACVIGKSSGSSALDSASCRILRSRARFTPAIDSHGNPARAGIAQEIEWRLPG